MNVVYLVWWKNSYYEDELTKIFACKEDAEFFVAHHEEKVNFSIQECELD